jgi:hypothetical protein
MSKGMDGSARRREADASAALFGGCFAASEPLADVEWQQVTHVCTRSALRLATVSLNNHHFLRSTKPDNLR